MQFMGKIVLLVLIELDIHRQATRGCSLHFNTSKGVTRSIQVTEIFLSINEKQQSVQNT